MHATEPPGRPPPRRRRPPRVSPGPARDHLDGATTAAVGIRFRGRNRQGLVRWGRVCEIMEIEPHVLVWRTVPTAFTPDSSEWRIRLEPTEDGTRIEQRYDIVRGAGPLEAVYATILPQHRDREAALVADLRRLGEVARRGHAEPANGRSSEAVG